MNSFSIISIALLIVGIVADTEFDDFGLPRIVGGEDAEEGQFPHQVSLRSRIYRQHFCGGSILTPRFILTAAHCTQSTNSLPRNVYAVVGALRRLKGGTIVELERITPHQQYNPKIYKNDISLIRTSTEIIFSEFVQPIALPSDNLPVNGDFLVTISGWGRTSYPSLPGRPQLPDILQFANASTLSLPDCRRRFKKLPVVNYIHDSIVCTTNPANQGACMGDSGGPLISEDKVLVGIVSWGIPCARGYPDVYTRVYSHIEWVQNEIEKQSNGEYQ